MKKSNALNRQKLKDIIKERNLSMAEISRLAGVSESYLKDLANGRLVSPTIDRFIKICTALEVSPYLLAPDLEKPTLLDIDELLLEQALTEILDTAKSIDGLTVKQKAQLVINRYKNSLNQK